MENQLLERRIAEARTLQASKSQPAVKRAAGGLKRATRALYRQIDRKHEKPALQHFRPEYKYAQPANTGTARNPLIFGKIPLEFQVQEWIENETVLYTEGLRNTNPLKQIQRVRAMNYPKSEINPLNLTKQTVFE